MSNLDICPGCLGHAGNAVRCPSCGYVIDTPQKLPALPARTMLAGRYVLGRMVAQDGEGLTYIALDTVNNRKVNVREFLPRSLATRVAGNDSVVLADGCTSVFGEYLSDFIEISRAVGRLNEQKCIEPLIDLFECNGTAYSVYRQVQGKSLTELVARAKKLTWEEARPIFMSLISSMISSHKLGLVHFGISPETVMMTQTGDLMLTNFRVPDARLAETDLDAELSPGYSALEQYSAEGETGKWTDVYALAATMLFALTGRQPADAVARSRESRLSIPTSIANQVPAYVLTALSNAMQVGVTQRTRTMEQFRDELLGHGAQQAAAYRPDYAPAQSQQRPAQPQPQPRPAQSQPRPVQSQRPAPRDEAPLPRPSKKRDSSLPWYQRLSQFQYWLLTLALALIVLGTIGVIVFFAVRPAIIESSSHVYNYSSGQNNQSTPQGGSGDEAVSAETFPVPKVVGLSWDDVQTNMEYIEKFDFVETDSQYSDDYGVGIIMAQQTPPDTMVSAGTTIAVTVSLGSQNCSIPNIIDMSVSDADRELTNAGLRLGSQSEEYSDTIAAGHVIRINGGAVGDRVQRGSAVSIVVSLGSEG